jgi:hypothetical protein
MRACQKKHSYPTLMGLDGDLSELETGTISSCLDALKQPGILAVSPEYDYDPESWDKFPLWGLRCHILKRIREYDLSLNPIRNPRIIGGLYCIEPKTLALMGGVPAEKNQDLSMTERLRHFFSIRWFEHNPIARPESSTATAYFNPSKELLNIIAERSPESHWHDISLQEQMSGQVRLPWKRLPNIEGSLLAKQVSQEGVLTVLQSVWELLAKLIPDAYNTNVVYQVTSSRFLRAILDLNIDLSGIRIETSLNIVLDSKQSIEHFLRKYDASAVGEYGKTIDEVSEEESLRREQERENDDASVTENETQSPGWKVTGVSGI